MKRLRKPYSHARWLVSWNLQVTALAAAVIAAVVASAAWAGRLSTLVSWTQVVFWGLLTVAAGTRLIAWWSAPSGHRPSPISSDGRAFAIIRKYHGFLAIVVSSFVLAGLGLLALGVARVVASGSMIVLGWIYSGAVPRGLMIAGTALGTATAGGIFFFFRLRQRFLYGLTEALAGMVVGGHRLSIEPGTGIPTETGFYFAVLTAGVYLVVRGLDNMHQAAKAGDGFYLRLRAALDAFAQPPPRPPSPEAPIDQAAQGAIARDS